MKKPKRVWIYIGEEEDLNLQEMLKAFPHLSEAAMTSSLLSAALRAARRNGYNNLPREFSVELDEPNETDRLKLNEPGSKKHR